MKELSTAKITSTIRMYFAGYTYDEIAVKNNVSKGTVFNIIAEVKAGVFPEAADLGEDIDLLRETAIDLKKAKLTPVKAVVGLSVLSTLASLNIEPSELNKFQSLIKAAAVPDADIPAFAGAALAVFEMKKATGLSLPEIETKASSLKDEVAKLEPLTEDLQHKKKELAQAQDSLSKINAEIQKAQAIYTQKQKEIEKSQVNESKIAANVAELEERAHLADKQLTGARNDLKKLAAVGLTLEDLATFTQQVKEVAAHHKLKPAALKDRLMNELKVLDETIWLEAVLEKKTAHLNHVDQLISEKSAKASALTASNNKLLAQRDALLADIATASQSLVKTIDNLGRIAEAAGSNLSSTLQAGIEDALQVVNKMHNAAFEAGQQIGEVKEVISANKWLHELLSLAKNEDIPDGNRIRVIGLMLLRPLTHWARCHLSATDYFLRTALENAATEVEKWQPQPVPILLK